MTVRPSLGKAELGCQALGCRQPASVLELLAQVPAETGLELVLRLCPLHRNELEGLLADEAYAELCDELGAGWQRELGGMSWTQLVELALLRGTLFVLLRPGPLRCPSELTWIGGSGRGTTRRPDLRQSAHGSG